MISYHIRYRINKDMSRFGGFSFWLLFRCLPMVVLVTLVLLLLLIAPTTSRASSGEARWDSDELQSGQLLLQNQGTGSYKPAVIQGGKVHFEVSGLVAVVTLEQSFHNTGNAWAEGVYAFPLPDDAAVRRLEMEIGERLIVGRIREREQAKKEYKRAKSQGKKASLVEQHRPNLFSNRVANIGPGEQVTVRLEYVQPVDYEQGQFSLRFPMTITSRYMPGRPLKLEEEQKHRPNPYSGWAVPTDQVPDADAISPLQYGQAGTDQTAKNAIEITAKLDMGMSLAKVASPYHDIAMSRSGDVYDISLTSGKSEMDRDFLLQWKPVMGAEPKAAFFTEQVGDEHFGLLLLVPPSVEKGPESVTRELIFVIDTSGSMGGVSIRQARASVRAALGKLREDDYFNIIEFNSQHRSLYRRSMPATRHHVQQAQEFVRQLSASGGTEMLSALQAALAPAIHTDEFRASAPLRQVIFITDGAVGNEQALFEAIKTMVGQSRLFTVGIGSAPNSWFMRKAAEFGRGSHTHIANVDEVANQMSGLFEKIAHPLAVDIKIRWPQPAEVWPQHVPDLYLGEPLILAVNFGKQNPAGEVTVTGEISDHPWRRTIALGASGESQARAQHQGVASLWAKQKIAAFLDKRVLGASEAEVRSEVLPLALQHQLLSPYTSFLAVEKKISRPNGKLLKKAPVPNTRPRGQTPQAAQTYAYPATATTAPANIWIGCLLLFVALITRTLARTESEDVA